MTYNQFRELLRGVTEQVYHFEAAGAGVSDRIIWQEAGRGGLYADNTLSESVQRVQLDIYVRSEDSPLFPSLLETLDEQDEITYRVEDTIQEEVKGNRLIRHIVMCEVIGWHRYP